MNTTVILYLEFYKIHKDWQDLLSFCFARTPRARRY